VTEVAHDAVMIGAGHNGLVTAAYLAQSGLEVLVLERREVVGGAATTEELFDGFQTSPCAYHLHLLQSRVVRDLGLREFGFDVRQIDPVYFSPYEDGRYLIQWRDVARTSSEIAKFSRHDATAYPDYLTFWRRAGRLFDQHTLNPAPTSISELVTHTAGTEDEELLDRLMNTPIRALMSDYFDNEAVQAALMPNSDTRSLDEPGELLGWAATGPNRGAEPDDQGLPVGGMGRFSEALLRAAEHAGVKVQLGADVAEILIDESGARGVRLSDGTTVRARVVLSNADPKRTFQELMPASAVLEELRKVVDSVDTDSGSLKFHAAVSELPDFSRHLGVGHDPRLLGLIRISPSMTYVEHSLADAAAGRATDSPILIVMIPTVYDASVAPPGTHLVSMRVKFEPSRLREGTWADQREAVTDQVIDVFTQFAPNFRRSILDHVMYTPDDIRDRVGLTDGNIHHIDHSAGQVLGDRLFPGGGYRTPIRNLFMCGAGTHPGGEVTAAPGHNAARVVLQSLNVSPRESVSVPR